MDVHPTKNVSIGIDPYPGSQKSPRLNRFFAQPRIAGPSLSWRSRRRLERLFTWRPSNPRAPPSRMMFKKKTARKVACKSHTQKKNRNIYIYISDFCGKIPQAISGNDSYHWCVAANGGRYCWPIPNMPHLSSWFWQDFTWQNWQCPGHYPKKS